MKNALGDSHDRDHSGSLDRDRLSGSGTSKEAKRNNSNEAGLRRDLSEAKAMRSKAMRRYGEKSNQKGETN